LTITARKLAHRLKQQAKGVSHGVAAVESGAQQDDAEPGEQQRRLTV
jgi:hypothetical protein